jgi:hypothetical protein
MRPPLLQGPRSLILAKLPLNGSGLRTLLNRSEDTRVLRYQDTLAIYTRPTEGMQDAATAAQEETLSRSGC